MVSVFDIRNWVQERFPAAWAEPWDSVGLQVGSDEAQVEHLVLALDPTRAVIEAAADAGATCLLTHHPLVFQALEALDLDADPAAAAVALAIQRGCAVIAAHTNADVASGGVADVLADLLGMSTSRVPLRTTAGAPATVGTGRVGELLEPADVATLASRAGEALGTVPRVFGDRGARVARLAVCGGSGGSYIAEASSADAYLTGDIKHHAALEAIERGLPLIDAGHYATERPWVEALAPVIQDAFPDISVSLSPIMTDPFGAAA